MLETFSQQLIFKQADDYTLPLVKRFYKQNGFRAQAPKGEAIYLALHGQSIISALRLSPVQNVLLLRSMCTHADYRRQGIGALLLEAIQSHLNDKECYCFPYLHLQGFYQQAQFQLLDAADAPEAIRDKFERYIKQGKDICLMKHRAQSVVE